MGLLLFRSFGHCRNICFITGEIGLGRFLQQHEQRVATDKRADGDIDQAEHAHNYCQYPAPGLSLQEANTGDDSRESTSGS